MNATERLPAPTDAILVAEDSVVQAELLRRTLERHGYRAITVRDGVEALAAARRSKPKAVITDIVMPEMDGYELCRTMKQDPDLMHVPVLLLTSLTHAQDVFRGLETGADDYLPKPWNEAELIRRLETLLAKATTETGQSPHEILEISFQGQRYTVESGRRQILALLLSVLEEAMRRNEELERKKRDLNAANELLQETNVKLEQANRSKSEFLARMSHELRTPLHSIIGFSDALLDDGATISPETSKRFLGHIRNAGQHLLELINDVLDLSKVEAGRMELHQELFDAREMLQSAYESVRPLADKKQQRLLVEVGPSVGLIYQDPRRFTQILYNLLSNAIKFTPDGGQISLHAIAYNDHLEVSVTDTGIGIEPEDQERILEEFHQIDSGYARIQQGTGLGLALVRRLLHMMGSEISIQSVPGVGSTFSFRLPIQKQKSDQVDS